MVLIAVPITGCGGRGGGFSVQSKILVVGEESRWFSWQFHTLVFGRGEAGVLMALPDAGCGGGEAGVLKAVPDAVCVGEVRVLMSVSHAGCGGRRMFSWPSQTLVWGGRGRGSLGSARHWLWGREVGCSWQ